MNLSIIDKNTEEIIQSFEMQNSSLNYFSDPIYSFDTKGNKILLIPQLNIRVQNNNVDFSFAAKELIREGNLITIIGEKDGVLCKLCFERGK